MANSKTISQVADIIIADSTRAFVVVSAPGKRDSGDVKVTDALYACAREKAEKGNCDEAFAVIEKRFVDIEKELGINIGIKKELAAIKKKIEDGAGVDFIASRGEYLSAKVLAAKLGVPFVDTEELIKFGTQGELLLDLSLDLIRARLAECDRAVLPGFYGSDKNGEVKTFSRGGSDITGAIIARAMNADVYENWTDVDGFLTADPRIIDKPALIDCLSYKELRELAYMGAEVLHPESIFPVRSAGIPINIRNTFNPSAKGTMIVADSKKNTNGGRVVTGIAGRKGFTIINIEKDMMNREIGFGRKALSVLEYEGVSFEHMPSGIDTLSLVIRDEYISGSAQKLVGQLRAALDADNIEIHSGLSLIAVVGNNMASRQGTAATIFTALAESHVNIRMIDQGSSEMNIIVGVDTFDYEKAISAIYYSFEA